MLLLSLSLGPRRRLAPALGATAVGCSHEHGPLSDTPDTTSLGTAGRWGAPYVSTTTGLTWRPSDPNAVIPGTVERRPAPHALEPGRLVAADDPCALPSRTSLPVDDPSSP